MPLVKFLVISDEHIFYPNSRLRDGYAPETIEDFAKYHGVITAGDTFDHHFSFHLALKKFHDEHPGAPKLVDVKGEEKLHPELKSILRASIYQARDILAETARRMAEINPDSHFFAMAGNHDNFTRHDYEMKALAGKQYNFHWHPEYFLLGDGLVTHGDTVLRKQDIENRETLKPRTYVEARLHYEVERQLHNALQVSWFLYWNQRDKVVPRFAENLKNQKNFKMHLEEIKHCFFGHVHVTPFDNVEYGGVRFHQAGASIMHRHCHPLEVVVDVPDNVIAFNVEAGRVIPMGGEENNIIYPGARIVSVTRANIRGLTHETKWQDMVMNKRQFVDGIGRGMLKAA